MARKRAQTPGSHQKTWHTCAAYLKILKDKIISAVFMGEWNQRVSKPLGNTGKSLSIFTKMINGGINPVKAEATRQPTRRQLLPKDEAMARNTGRQGASKGNKYMHKFSVL